MLANDVEKRIKKNPSFQIFQAILRTIRLKNPDISLYTVLIIFVSKVRNYEIRQRAYAVAFNFTLALFPAIIFLMTLIPYMPINNFSVVMMSFLGEMIPKSIFQEFQDPLKDIISKQQGGLMSFGFFFALYTSTNGMRSLMHAFDECYPPQKRRSFAKSAFIATFLTMMLGMVLMLSVGTLVYGKVLISSLLKHKIIERADKLYFLNGLRYLAILVGFFFGTSLIYYLAPSVKRRWKFISIGSLTATILCSGFSIAFSFYLNNFNIYNRLYGSLGAIIGFMLWIFAISFVLLVGFQLNSTLDQIKSEEKYWQSIEEQ